MWTIPKIESLGFRLESNHKLWCHFIGHGFDVYINLDTTHTKGNRFNFHSKGNNYKGYFKADLDTIEEFEFLLRIIK